MLCIVVKQKLHATGRANGMEYTKDVFHPASLRWHYPNQVFGYDLSQSSSSAPRACSVHR